MAPIQEIRVLVTGFGTFRDSPQENASWEIAKRLPSTLAATPDQPSLIRIHTHPEPVPVSYQQVNGLIYRLHDETQAYHIVLHIGVASGPSQYRLETQARRNVYNDVDVDNMIPAPETEPVHWRRCPDMLKPGAGCEDVLKIWKSQALLTGNSDSELLVSADAGGYLCEYLLYSSLAYYYSQNNHLQPQKSRREAALLHVPNDTNAQAIAHGVRVSIALIRAIAIYRGT